MKRFLALILAVTFTLLMGTAFAEEAVAQPTLLSAVGRSTAESCGTRAVLCFELSTFGQTVAEAQSLMETSLKTLKDALAQQGVEEKDIFSTRYDVNAKYDYHYTKLTETQILTGYSVVVALETRVADAQNVGTIIDAVNAAGVDCACDLMYEDLHAPDAFDAALAKAAQEAVRKAGLLAEASGLKLDKLVSIEETSVQDAAEVRVTYTVK